MILAKGFRASDGASANKYGVFVFHYLGFGPPGSRRTLPRPLGVSGGFWTIVRNCGPNSMWISKQKGPLGHSFPAILNVFWRSRGAGVLRYSFTIRCPPCAVPRACS